MPTRTDREDPGGHLALYGGTSIRIINSDTSLERDHTTGRLHVRTRVHAAVPSRGPGRPEQRTYTFEAGPDEADKLLLELHSAISTLRGIEKPPPGRLRNWLVRVFKL